MRLFSHSPHVCTNPCSTLSPHPPPSPPHQPPLTHPHHLTNPPPTPHTLQDADRLDAIGAVGVARCLTFGGRFNRALHDPSVPPRDGLTREQYTDKAAAAQQTTINHFHEKLLKLKALMRTNAGRAAAEGRHAFMEGFLRQFHAEWRGEA